MAEKRSKCPDCGEKVRGSNLARHRRSHMPTPERRLADEVGKPYIFYAPARRPLLQYRTHDTRYDELAPRGHGDTRYRIYRLRGGELQLIAAAATPCSFGCALVDLKTRGEFISDDATGVLDTAEDPGGWIVHPFALGRTRREN
jgi:hypothetical protein